MPSEKPPFECTYQWIFEKLIGNNPEFCPDHNYLYFDYDIGVALWMRPTSNNLEALTTTAFKQGDYKPLF